MKVVEPVIDKTLRDKVQIDNVLFGCSPGRGITDAIFDCVTAAGQVFS